MDGRPVITLTTDFGLRDPYVAAMKGVILSICPEAQIVDVTHEVPPQDVREGAFALYSVWRHFPAGTIHVAVVDSGVGSERRAVAVRTQAALFVAPDNGLLSYILAYEPALEAVELVNRAFQHAPVSATFHGRDVFAPAAAHLANGVRLNSLGPPAPDLTLLALSHAEVLPDGSVRGRIIYVDRFGNLITSIRQQDLPPGTALVVAGGREVRFGHTYADAATGEALALIGSIGHLEIAVREGSAGDALGLRVSDKVLVIPFKGTTSHMGASRVR